MTRAIDTRLAKLEATTSPAAMHQIILADPTDKGGEFYGLAGDALQAAVDKRKAELPPMAGVRAIIPIETTHEKENE